MYDAIIVGARCAGADGHAAGSEGISGAVGRQGSLSERHDLHDFTCQLALLEPPPPHMQQLFVALRDKPNATNRFLSAITGSSPLPAFMNPETP
jgi:hypothetical protein